MSRRPARFTQADIRRAIQAAEKASASNMAVEILPDGTIRISPIPPQGNAPEKATPKKGIVL
jgi:hypothetical protein